MREIMHWIKFEQNFQYFVLVIEEIYCQHQGNAGSGILLLS